MTSPIPRMRCASRSGWNTSNPSVFSLTPRNLIGTPVTARILIAAPPRASPSTFVRIKPVIPPCLRPSVVGALLSAKRLLNPSAIRTASWPVMASATSSTSAGLTLRLISTSSSINRSSICKRPAVSIMTTVAPLSAANFTPRSQMSGGDALVPSSYIGMSSCFASVRNCSTAAGRCVSAAIKYGRRPSLRSLSASLAAMVVLPAPCRPTSINTRGVGPLNDRVPPSPSVSSSSS